MPVFSIDAAKRKAARMQGWLTRLATLLAGTTGCATLISGSHQTILVHSLPPGAEVAFGHQTGTTPVRLSLPKGRDHPLRIRHGPDKRVVVLQHRLDPVALLNLIPPLWPGLLVDLATGALTTYDPDAVSIEFRSAYAKQARHPASRP